jgi:hypothetical protein
VFALLILWTVVIRIADSTDESPHWTEKALEGSFINPIKTE